MFTKTGDYKITLSLEETLVVLYRADRRHVAEHILNLVNKAVNDEREACALLCEKLAAEMERDPMCDPGHREGALRCVEAIRARGTHEHVNPN